MPLIAAALVPHTPLLLPNVGKEHFRALQKTRGALEQLDHELHALQPDCLVILTPHGERLASFSFGVAEELFGSLAEFGDLASQVRVAGSPLLAERWRSALVLHGMPVVLQTETALDYGVTVPLHFLHHPSRGTPVVPMRLPSEGADRSLPFGRLLAEAFHETSERIAFLASADLSHRPTATAADLGKRGKSFDTLILRLLREKRFEDVLGFSADDVAAAETCGYEPLRALIGVLTDRPVRPDFLSYEAPFGIGHAVIHFILP